MTVQNQSLYREQPFLASMDRVEDTFPKINESAVQNQSLHRAKPLVEYRGRIEATFPEINESAVENQSLHRAKPLVEYRGRIAATFPEINESAAENPSLDRAEDLVEYMDGIKDTFSEISESAEKIQTIAKKLVELAETDPALKRVASDLRRQLNKLHGRVKSGGQMAAELSKVIEEDPDVQLVREKQKEKAEWWNRAGATCRSMIACVGLMTALVLTHSAVCAGSFTEDLIRNMSWG